MADLLPELLDANLSQGLHFYPGRPLDVRETPFDPRTLVPEGRTRREAITELAESLSGVSGRGRSSSPTYRNARRAVERWSRGARPTGYRLGRLQLLEMDRSDRLAAFRAHGGEMKVLVINAMSTPREEWLPPGRGQYVRIPREAMRRVIASWRERDLGIAAGRLWAAFLRSYRVPNVDDWEGDVDVIELELRPS